MTLTDAMARAHIAKIEVIAGLHDIDLTFIIKTSDGARRACSSREFREGTETRAILDAVERLCRGEIELEPDATRPGGS